MTMVKGKKRVIGVLTAAMALFLSLAVIFSLTPVKTASADRSTTAWVTIDEIYDDSSSKFKAKELKDLYRALAGNDVTSLNALKGKMEEKGGTLTSADFRTAGGGSNNVSVTFGGKKWDAVYLTKATNGDIILDLWRSVDELTSGDVAPYSAWKQTQDSSGNAYPSNMYSTSKIRVDTLNAGGQYSTSGSDLTAHAQSSSNQYARFTMSGKDSKEKDSLIAYLAKPSEVGYQADEWDEATANSVGSGNNCIPNDAYEELQGKDWNNGNNYLAKDNNREDGAKYGSWKDDYLWLPSLTETGKEDGNGNGIWDTDVSLRSAIKESYNYYWLRSGMFNHAGRAYIFNNSGNGGNNDHSEVSLSAEVRPALHLNLTAAARTAGMSKDDWGGTKTYNPTGVTWSFDDADNVTITPVGSDKSWWDGATKTITATKVGEYKIQVEPVAGLKWDDDTTDQITATYKVVPADMVVTFNYGKLEKRRDIVYESNMEEIPLKLPDPTDPEFPISWTGVDWNEGNNKDKIKIQYIVTKHEEENHNQTEIDDYLTRLKRGEDSTAWKDYGDLGNDQTALEPMGYVVYFKAVDTEDNHNPCYDYFSIHIADEKLKITLTEEARMGFEKGVEYGDVTHTKDSFKTSIIGGIESIKATAADPNEPDIDRTREFKDNIDNFTFYLRKDNTGGEDNGDVYTVEDDGIHLHKSGSAKVDNLPLGTYHLYVAYTSPPESGSASKYITFEWDGGRPSFIVSKRKVKVTLTFHEKTYGQDPTDWVTATASRATEGATGEWYASIDKDKGFDIFTKSYSLQGTRGGGPLTSPTHPSKTTPADTYTVTPMWTNDNYEVTFDYATGGNSYIVKKASLSVSYSGETKIYNESEQEASIGSITGANRETLTKDTDYTLEYATSSSSSHSATKPKEVGEYSVYVVLKDSKLAKNYTAPTGPVGTFTIDPAVATVEVGGDKEYYGSIETAWSDITDGATVTWFSGSASNALTLDSNIKITLDLQGSGLSGNVSIFNGTLTLQGTGTLNGGVTVSGGAFNMAGGTITNKNGSGVTVSGGTFTMSGGTITGCKAIGNSKDDENGRGGGVYVKSGTFTMVSGEISGNEATRGGGVYKAGSGATFTMQGGEIKNNTATAVTDGGGTGGGVEVGSGTFEMTGGTISGNKAQEGAGVYVENSGTFNLNGASASITTNTADKNGGGVYMTSKAHFTMTGGSIKENTAEGNGPDVYVHNKGTDGDGVFTWGGGSIGTVYLGTGTFITVQSSFTPPTVTITIQIADQTLDTPFKVLEWTGSDPTSHFKSAIEEACFYKVGTEAFIGKHSIVVDGASWSGYTSVTFTGIHCEHDGCDKNFGTVTLDGERIQKGEAKNVSCTVKEQTYSATLQASDLSGISEQYATFGSGTTATTIEQVEGDGHHWVYTSDGTTITATCDHSYHDKDNGDGEKTFTITLGVPEGDLTYNGAAHPATVTGATTAEPFYDAAEDTPKYAIKYGYRKNSELPFSDMDTSEKPTNAGYYQATLTIGEKSVSVTFQIAKRQLTASITVPTDLVYGNVKGNECSATLNGLVTGDETDVQAVLNYSGTANDGTSGWGINMPQKAGDNYTVTVTLGGAKADNYELTGTVSQNFEIAKATITVSGTYTDSKTYDGKEYSKTVDKATAETKDFTVNMSPADDSFRITIKTNEGLKDARNTAYTNTDGEVTVNFTYDSNNFELDNKEAKYSITITAKTLNASDIDWSDDTTFEYDGNPHTLTATIATGVTKDGTIPLTITLSCEGFTGENAINANKYTATATLPNEYKGNYTLGSGDNTHKDFTITPRNIEIKWENVNDLTYNGANQTPTPQLPENIPDVDKGHVDRLSVTVHVDGDYADADTYTATAVLDGTSKGNYNIINGSETQKYTIAQKTLDGDITWTDAEGGEYDGAAHHPQAKIEGVNGELTLTVTRTSPDSGEASYKDVGNYEFSAELSGTDAKNYQWGSVSRTKTVTVTKATITLPTLAPATYNGTEQKPTILNPLNGVSGEMLTLDTDYTVSYQGKKTENTTPKNADEYTVTVELTSENALKNYQFEGGSPKSAPLTYTIDKASLTASLSASVEYGDALTLENVTISVAPEALGHGDNAEDIVTAIRDQVTVTEFTGYTVGTNAGTPNVKINHANAVELDNYTVTFKEGTVTIKKRNITITLEGTMSATYGNTDGHGISATAKRNGSPEWYYKSDEQAKLSTDLVIKFAKADGAGVEYSSTLDAATYNLSVDWKADSTLATNYNVELDTTYQYTIEKQTVKAPTIESKVYDGTQQQATIDVTGKPYEITKNEGGTNVGQYEVVLTLTHPENYKWSDDETSAEKTLYFKITAAKLEMEIVLPSDLTYGKVGTFTVRFTGLIASDNGKVNPVWQFNGTPNDNSSYSDSVAPTLAGKYTVNVTGISGDSAENYDFVAPAQKSFEILRATLTGSITWTDAEGNVCNPGDHEYDGTEHTLKATIGGVRSDGDLDLEVKMTEHDSESVLTDAKFRNVGSYKFEASLPVSYQTNYEFQPSNKTLAVQITPKVIESVKWQKQKSFTYTGNTLATPTATFDGVGTDGNNIRLDVSEKNSKEFKDVGSYTFQATLSADYDKNYDLNGEMVETFTITPAAVSTENVKWKVDGNSVIGDSYSVTYDGAEHTVTLELSIDGGATVTLTPGSDKDPSSNKYKDAVTYTFTATDANFVDGSWELTITVDKAKLTVKLTATNKEYDGTANATVTGEISGKFGSDDVSVGEITAYFEDANAGKDKAITVESVALEGAAKDNYAVELETLPTVTGEITKATITVELNPASSTYNGEGHEVSVRFSGMKHDETLTSADYEINVSGAGLVNNKPQNAGEYNVKVTLKENGPVSKNYQFENNTSTFDSLTYTIEKATVTEVKWYADGSTVITKDSVLTYDGAEHKVTLVLTYDGGSITLDPDGDKTYKDAKGYTFTVTDGSGNFTQSEWTLEITVKQATLTVTLTATVEYGEATPEVNMSLEGLKGDDSGKDNDFIEQIKKLLSFGGYEAGTTGVDKTNTIEVTATDLTNYKIVLSGKPTLEITPRQLKATITGLENHTYGDTWNPTATFDRLVDGDEADVQPVFNYAGTAYDGTSVSDTTKPTHAGNNYKVWVSGLTGDKASNYTIVEDGEATFSIARAKITLGGTFTDTKEYDGSPYSATVDRETAVKNGLIITMSPEVDDPKFSITITTTEKDARGDAYTGSGAVTYDTNNFELTIDGAKYSITITPQEVNVVWDSLTLTYNGAEQAPTASATDKQGHGVTPIEVKVSGDHTAVGTYTATATTTNDNYTLSNNEKEFTIVAYEIELTADEQEKIAGYITTSKVYDGNTDVTLKAAQDPLYRDDLSVRFTLSAKYNSKNVLEAKSITVTVTLSDTHNFKFKETAGVTYTVGDGAVTITWTISEGVSITAKPLNVTWNGLEQTYASDSLTPTASVTATDVVSGESVTLSVVLSDGATGHLTEGKAINAGTYNATVSISGPDENAIHNYSLTGDTTTFTIDRANLTITWDVGEGDYKYTYGSVPKTPSATIVESGIKGEDKSKLSLEIALSDPSKEFKAVQNGAPYTFKATLVGDAAGNYTITNSTQDYTITRATLVLDMTATVEYGDTVSEEDVTLTVNSGFVSGDDQSAILAAAKKAAAFVFTGYTAGTTGVSASGTIDVTSAVGTLDNYTVQYNSCKLTITKRQITVTLSGTFSNTYGASNHGDITASAERFGKPGDWYGNAADKDLLEEGTGLQFTFKKKDGTGNAVEYTSDMGAGDYTIGVTLTGSLATNYELTNADTGISYTVNKMKLAKPSATTPSVDELYRGSAYEIDITGFVNATMEFELSDNVNSSFNENKFTATNVGNYTLTISLKDGDNYEWAGTDQTDPNFTITIRKAENGWQAGQDLTLKGWTYGDKANDPSATPKFGEAKNVTFTYTHGSDQAGKYFSDKPTNAGTYWVKAHIDGTDNYNAFEQAIEFTISRRTITITESEVSVDDKTYDGTEEVLATFVHFTAKGVIDSDKETVTVIVQSATLENANANDNASVTITFAIKGDVNGNYQLEKTTVTKTMKVNRASIAVEWSDYENLTYNGRGQEVTASVTGVTVNGKAEEVTLTITYSAQAGSSLNEAGKPQNAGSYTATASTENGNYTFTNATQNFEIAKATANVTIAVPQNAVYNREKHEATVDVAVSGAPKPDYTITYNGKTYGADEPVNADTYTVTVALTANAAKNYQFDEYGKASEERTFTIAKAKLSISELAKYTYNGVDQFSTVKDAILSNIINSLSASVLPTPESVSVIEQEVKNAGPYSITVELSADDYKNFAFDGDKQSTTVSVTVDPAKVTVEISGGFTYDGETHNGNDILAQGTVTATFSGTTTTGLSEGSLAVSGSVKNYKDGGYSVGLDGSGADITVKLADSNYTLTAASGTVIVNKAPITVEWKVEGSYTYTDNVFEKPTPSIKNGNYDGNNLTVGLDESSHSTEFKDAGRYTFTAELGGTAAGNYTIQDGVTITVTINKGTNEWTKPDGKEVTLDNWTYDAGTMTHTPSAPSKFGNGTATFEYFADNEGSVGRSLGDTQPKDAGTYWVKATVAGDGDNYDAIEFTVQFTIKPKSVTVTWKGLDGPFTYTGDILGTVGTEIKASFKGEGEDGTIVLAVTFKYHKWGETVYASATEFKNAGEYRFTADFKSDEGVAKTNYELGINKTKDIEVAKAELTVTANDHHITYGDAPSNNGVTFGGFQGTDTQAVVTGTVTDYEYSYTQFGDVGTYTITPIVSPLTADNYNFKAVSGTLTVDRATLTFTLDPASRTYTGAGHDVSVTFDGTVSGEKLTKGSDYTITVEKTTVELVDGKPQNVGTYTVTVTLKTDGDVAKNYELASETATYIINQATASAKWYADYGTEAKKDITTGADLTYDGAEHEVTLELTYADSKTVTFTSSSNTYRNAADEYTFTVTDESGNFTASSWELKITVKKATLEVDYSKSATYNGEEQVPEITVTGVGSDTITENGENGYTVTYTELESGERKILGVNGKPFGAGSYNITFGLHGDVATNYEVPMTGTFEILKADMGTAFGEGGKMSSLQESVYHTDMAPVELKLPEPTDPEFPITWANKSWKDANVTISYIVLKHEETAHGAFTGKIEDYLDKLQRNETIEGKSWVEYTPDNSELNVTDPFGYCVFFKIVDEDGNHNDFIYYFSVHIAHEQLDIYLNADAVTAFRHGEVFEYGDFHDSESTFEKHLANGIEKIISNVDGNSETNRKDEFIHNIENFTFYFRKDDQVNGHVYYLDGDNIYDHTDSENALVTNLPLGTYYIFVSYSGDTNGEHRHVLFTWYENTGKEYRPSFKVGPRKITVELSFKSYAYGEDPVNWVSVTASRTDKEGNWYAPDENDFSILQLKCMLGSGEFEPTSTTNAGEYTLTPVCGNKNYEVTFADKSGAIGETFTYTVEKALVDAPTVASKVYSGEPQTANVTETDDYTVESNEGGTDVGSYDVVLKLTHPNNYMWSDSKVSDDKTLKFEITPKHLTVTAKDNTITYGDAPSHNGVEYSGFVKGEDEHDLAGELAYTYGYTQYQNIGDYAITPAGLTSGNYEIEFVHGKLTVTRRQISVNWESATYTYTGSQLTLPAATADGVNGDHFTLLVTIEVSPQGDGAFLHAGSYTLAASFPEGNAKANNYTLTGDLEKDYTIERAVNSWAAAPSMAGWVYDRGTGTHTPAATPKFGQVTFTYSANPDSGYSDAQPIDAGTYWVKAYVAGTADYGELEGTATFTIQKRQVTADWNKRAEYVYSGTVQSAPTATAAGVKETLTLTVTLDGEFRNAGSYTFHAALDVSSESNYTLTGDTVTVVIQKKQIAAEWEARSYTYNGSEFALPEVTVTGFAGDELFVTVALSDPAKTFKNAGSYFFIATLGGAAASNYTLTGETREYVIAKAELSMPTLAKDSFPYTGENLVPAVEAVFEAYNDALMAHDFHENEAEGVLEAVVNAGGYYVRFTSADPNYGWHGASYVTVPFTVARRSHDDLKLTADSVSATYGDAPETLQSTTHGVPQGFDVIYVYTYEGIEGTEYPLTNKAPTDVGKYLETVTVIYAGSRNEEPFTITARTILIISARSLTFEIEWPTDSDTEAKVVFKDENGNIVALDAEDYFLTYSQNGEEVEKLNEAGEYTVTVTLKGRAASNNLLNNDAEGYTLVEEDLEIGIAVIFLGIEILMFGIILIIAKKRREEKDQQRASAQRGRK